MDFFAGMYVLRDRLISAEFWDFVLSTETCYFINKRDENGALPSFQQCRRREPNAELYSDVVYIITILPYVQEVVAQFI